VFDVLTTRSYRGALGVGVAFGKLAESRPCWRPGVYDAFMRVVAELPPLSEAV
jgi:hypothetical protein